MSGPSDTGSDESQLTTSVNGQEYKIHTDKDAEDAESEEDSSDEDEDDQVYYNQDYGEAEDGHYDEYEYDEHDHDDRMQWTTAEWQQWYQEWYGDMDTGDDEEYEDEKYEEDDVGGPPGGHPHDDLDDTAVLAGQVSARFDDLEDKLVNKQRYKESEKIDFCKS